MIKASLEVAPSPTRHIQAMGDTKMELGQELRTTRATYLLLQDGHQPTVPLVDMAIPKVLPGLWQTTGQAHADRSCCYHVRTGPVQLTLGKQVLAE